MRVRNRYIRLFTVLFCLMLIIPANVSTISYAQSDSKSHTISTESNIKAEDKISKRLLNQFDDKQYVTFLIKFKDQVDSIKVAAQAAENAKSQKLTEAKSELMGRSAVVSSLRSKAMETQDNVKEFLENKKKAGNVKEYESFYIVNAMAVTGTEDVMNELEAFGEIEKILPNEIRQQIQPVQQNTVKESVKANNTAETSTIEWNIEKVGAPQAWNMGIDGSGIVVANIDTGVQWDHPALKEKYRGYDPAHPDHPNNEFNWFDATNGEDIPYDTGGHGTHTMGTMVGADKEHHIGVAPGAKWIAVKAFTTLGATDADLLQSGEWILAPKDSKGNPHPEKAPDIVNNSWGGGPGLNEWYRLMVQNWRAADILPVFSAGNAGSSSGTVSAPGNYPESFTVGATDIDDKLASFSSRGPAPYDEIKPNLSAPGVNILSSVPGNEYHAMHGTSMAAPHVAAAAALLLQANSSLTVDDLEQILIKAAKPLTDSKYTEVPNSGYGYGLLNVFKAVSSITNGFGTVKGQVLQEGHDTTAPTFQHYVPAEAYDGLSLPLEISVKDNVSVQKVELQYRTVEGQDWKNVEALRTSGNYLDGTYQATIPDDTIAQPSIFYRWNIVDFGGNAVTSDDYSVKIVSGVSAGYKQDFEAIPIGWYSYGKNNSWEWGVFSTSGPIKPGADAKNKMYATNLSGPYGRDADMSLAMPPINVPEGQTYLNFKHWYGFEYKTDFGRVFVSTDQTNWENVAEFGTTASGWQDGKVDLTKYAGQKIFVIFNVQSNSSYQAFGWYLDDVDVSNTPLNGSNIENLVDVQEKTGLDLKYQQKKLVNTDNVKPGKQINIALPNVQDEDSKNSKSSVLPLQARVSVLETGRSVNTNPADGSYSLGHESGSYTLRAEAYGFQSANHTVEITNGNGTIENFTLEPIPQGTVTGRVMNKATGKPIKNATLMLLEDAVIHPVKTDENGQFTITAYEGTYTMHVSAPNNFYNQDIKITISGGKNTEQNVELKPFIGHPGEIGYDDGTGENGHAGYQSIKYAVKMSLPEGKDRALVTSGVFRFWEKGWPVPGGTQIQVAIYDASGPYGKPGKQIAGPIDATAQLNGEWTEVDLTGEGIIVEGDFYMVYIQPNKFPNVPGITADKDGEIAYRSWMFTEGKWTPTPNDVGNLMIRARVSYEVDTPIITEPVNGTYTNQSNVTVKGVTAPLTPVHILRDGKEIATTTANEDGKFISDISIVSGNNVITATASTETETTETSEPVKVILDQVKPKLTITSPVDGMKTDREAVTVEGTVSDENFDSVEVNGKKATVNEAGFYSVRILLEYGENKIKVVAADKSGNITTLSRTVSVDNDNVKPVISGATNKTININSTFNPKTGVTAKDNVDGDLTNKIKISGTVNTKKKGTYTLTYSVSDKSGNKTEVKRKITVK
ncbi:S8 family serine peptidase [Paenisporosarcina sp. FSL H8-0542]|uniref:S8 family serine peptidase n=1 Tax=Paenisporosarcina sp. FSL H8-0542 TaxID=2921401 RepID=UPI00315A61AB